MTQSLNSPLSPEELMGAYKVLAYFAPNSFNIERMLDRLKVENLAPHGAFLRLLELPEVQDTLCMKQIKENCRPFSFTMSHGPTLFGYVWDRFVSVEAARTGTYEPDVQAILRKILKPGDTAIDIGANIGCHTSLMCEIVGLAGRVHAIEPAPETFVLLELMKEGNNYSQLMLHNVAASDETAVLPMNIHPTNLGGNSISLVSDTATKIRALPLDFLLSNISPVHLIKIDVEGFESQALAGAWSIIEKNRPSIIMEFSPGTIAGMGRSPHDLLSQFLEIDYKIERTSDFSEITSIEHELDRMQNEAVPFIDLLLTPR